MPWNVTKQKVVSGNAVQKRVTLVDRAGQAGSRGSTPVPAVKPTHGRSASSTVGRSVSSGLSKSVGARPNSAQGMYKSSGVNGRPASAQGMQQPVAQENALADVPQSNGPRRKGMSEIWRFLVRTIVNDSL